MTQIFFNQKNEVGEKFAMLHICKGHAVVQLVEALHCKPEGRGFDSRCCHWNFLLT